MPRTGSDVNHTAITDHRIPRASVGHVSNVPERTAREPTTPAWPQAGQIPLVRFPRDSVDPDNKETARDLGMALMDLAERQPDRTARQLSGLALPMLQSAVTSAPADPPAWEAMGSAFWFQGRLGEGLAAYENALRQAPERETSLFLAATLALRSKQRAAARGYAERAIQLNPWRWQYHHALATIYSQAEDWREAVRECQEALQLNPAGLATRRVLVTGYLRTGDTAKARTEFEILLSLSQPEQQEALRRWFAQQVR
jgi:tetratricopeptide (TPR) repeat protein